MNKTKAIAALLLTGSIVVLGVSQFTSCSRIYTLEGTTDELKSAYAELGTSSDQTEEELIALREEARRAAQRLLEIEGEQEFYLRLATVDEKGESTLKSRLAAVARQTLGRELPESEEALSLLQSLKAHVTEQLVGENFAELSGRFSTLPGSPADADFLAQYPLLYEQAWEMRSSRQSVLLQRKADSVSINKELGAVYSKGELTDADKASVSELQSRAEKLGLESKQLELEVLTLTSLLHYVDLQIYLRADRLIGSTQESEGLALVARLEGIRKAVSNTAASSGDNS